MANSINLQTRLQQLARASVKQVVSDFGAASTLLTGGNNEAAAEAIRKHIEALDKDLEKKLLASLSEAIRGDEVIGAEKQVHAEEQKRREDAERQRIEKEQALIASVRELRQERKVVWLKKNASYRAYAMVFAEGLLGGGRVPDGLLDGVGTGDSHRDSTVAVGRSVSSMHAPNRHGSVHLPNS